MAAGAIWPTGMRAEDRPLIYHWLRVSGQTVWGGYHAPPTLPVRHAALPPMTAAVLRSIGSVIYRSPWAARLPVSFDSRAKAVRLTRRPKAEPPGGLRISRERPRQSDSALYRLHPLFLSLWANARARTIDDLPPGFSRTRRDGRGGS